MPGCGSPLWRLDLVLSGLPVLLPLTTARAWTLARCRLQARAAAGRLPGIYPRKSQGSWGVSKPRSLRVYVAWLALRQVQTPFASLKEVGDRHAGRGRVSKTFGAGMCG